MIRIVFLSGILLCSYGSWGLNDADIQVRFLEKVQGKSSQKVAHIDSQREKLLLWRPLCQKGPPLEKAHLCFHFWSLAISWSLPGVDSARLRGSLGENCKRLLSRMKSLENVEYIFNIKGLPPICYQLAENRQKDLIYINR